MWQRRVAFLTAREAGYLLDGVLRSWSTLGNKNLACRRMDKWALHVDPESLASLFFGPQTWTSFSLWDVGFSTLFCFICSHSLSAVNLRGALVLALLSLQPSVPGPHFSSPILNGTWSPSFACSCAVTWPCHLVSHCSLPVFRGATFGAGVHAGQPLTCCACPRRGG